MEKLTITKEYTKKEAFERFIEIYRNSEPYMIHDKDSELYKLACFC